MRRPATILAIIAALAVGLAPLPAVAKKGPDYEIDQQALAATVAGVEAATGQDALSGEIAGAAWIAQVPDNWNGDLVVYAHGFRGETPRLTVDPPPAFEFLVAQGYAWAASSYRRNDYDPGIGVIDTKNVTRHMQSMLGPELDKTYLTGASMGGHVTAAAIEQYPQFYDGAMPICGVLGDVELFDYFADYSLAAAAYAGLDADSFAYPDEQWSSTTVPDIQDGLSFAPGPGWAFALNQQGQEFKEFVEVGSGGDRVTYDVAWQFWHNPGNQAGNFLFNLSEGDGTIANRSGAVQQTSDTVYAEEYGPAFASLDGLIKRVDAANRVRKAIYAEEVAANGRSDLLVQRAIRDVGHCSFAPQEIISAYTDLFTWVETGVKPAGEDLVNDISSPTLGCQFTNPTGGSGLRALLDLQEPCPAG
jgi:pimeloyl-ACP methyl ester carboxylesterase